jgi:plastocyanin
VATGYTFKRKLTKPGTYKIYCSLHDDMLMTIVVKKH